MTINFTRVGTAFGAPAIEVMFLEDYLTQQTALASYHPHSILGALNAIVGAGLDFLAPHMAPNVAAGLLDAGGALLGLRAGVNLKAQAAPPVTARVPAARIGTRSFASPAGVAAGAGMAQQVAPAIGKQRTGTTR